MDKTHKSRWNSRLIFNNNSSNIKSTREGKRNWRNFSHNMILNIFFAALKNHKIYRILWRWLWRKKAESEKKIVFHGSRREENTQMNFNLWLASRFLFFAVSSCCFSIYSYECLIYSFCKKNCVFYTFFLQTHLVLSLWSRRKVLSWSL